MQRKAIARGILWMLLTIHLLCLSATAMAGVLMPMDEVQDDYYYKVEFGDAGFDIALPVRFRYAGMLLDEEDRKQLIFMEEEEGKPCFTITGIRKEAFGQMQATDLSWADLAPVFEEILEECPERALLTPLGAWEEANPLLAIWLPGETELWHAAGLQGDWLLVLTLYPGDGDAEALAFAREKMADLARQMITPAFEFAVVGQISLENSDICLTLPEGMEAVVDPYDEYGYTVYYLRATEDSAMPFNLHISTAYQGAYLGKAIQELSGDQLNNAASLVFVGVGESWNDWLPLDGLPALWLMEELAPGNGVSHLLYIQDGWLVGVTGMCLNPGRDMSLEELSTFQLSIMKNLIRGSDAPASWEPERVSLQSEAGTFEIAMEHGFLMYQRVEESNHIDCYVVNVMDSREQYILSIHQPEDPRLASLRESPEDLSALEEKLEAVMRSPLTAHVWMEEGLLNQETLLFFTEDGAQAIAVADHEGFRIVTAIIVPDMPDNNSALMDLGNRFLRFYRED